MTHRSICLAVLLACGCQGDEKISDTNTPSGGWDGDGGDDGADGGDGGGDDGSDGTCDSDSDCGDGYICEDGECEAGDRNNDFDEAESLRFIDGSDESARTVGRIHPVGDRDYFAF